MQAQGYRILPVNPGVESVLGEKSYASLTELPEMPDVVNVFRLPKAIPAIVDEMLELGLKNMWVQTGILNEAAAAKAEAGGIRVVMDRCIMVEHRVLRGRRE
jgi:predicted CoA-binding protein